MSFVHIKRQQIRGSGDTIREAFAVQAIAITTPGGQKKLIPNPAGNEAAAFGTFDEAVEAVKHAGFDYIFEGKKVYLNRSISVPKPMSRRSGPEVLEEAIPILIERLGDREPAVVANAAAALGELKDGAAVGPLGEILGHEDPTVRKSVAEAMAKLGPPALDVLRQAYETARHSNEKNAAHARLTVMSAYVDLAHTHRELLTYVMPQAVDALEDENWLVRAQAALVIKHAAQFFREDQEPS